MFSSCKFLTWKILALSFLLACSIHSFSQATDSIKKITQFEGSIQLTNKGISTVPNYTLGKPAAIFFFSAGRKLRFEPELRFALEGRPWMFIFWGRYDLLKTERLYTRIRVNYSDNFIKMTDSLKAEPVKTLRALQALTAEISQSFFITKTYSIGLYYMYVYGFDKDAARNMHFISLRNSFLNVKVSKLFYLNFVPQFYYLRVDKEEGVYFSEALTLGRKNFPLSVSSIINQPLKTNIPVNNHLLWNVTLVYAFNYK